jgi:hypothetical protein
MFSRERKKIVTTFVVFLFVLSTCYAQSYNIEIEAKLEIKKENGNVIIKGKAFNKTQSTKDLTYKLLVFKTGPNQNKSNNKQSGKFIIKSNEQQDLSALTINFNKETKVIVLLLIYDSNLKIIGKDRVVINDDKDNSIDVKKNIVSKINSSSKELSSQVINEDFEAKMYAEDKNGIVIINSTAFNKTEITESLKYRFTLFSIEENENTIEEEKSGRFIVSANKKVSLSSITFKLINSDRKVAVLLIYNLENELIAKDRIVFNDKKESKKKLSEKLRQEQEYSKDISLGREDGLELRGIILEDTKTKPGRDFYKLFYSLYTKNQINGDKVVKIKEVLALGRNTKIEVIVGGDIVFSFFVRPSLEYLTKINDYAIIKVYKHFNNLEKESKTIKKY